ncbi:hypothetical protein DIREPILLOW8_140 [Vibrio phage Direpillow8]|uniref:Uncharacterized protein n=1 Tax=Vibrio phage Bennett TaxID=2735171 RepID=A0A6M4ESA7_9CAUD|nr:hypothetical protein KNU87_gp168 [Vibrio phage Bennett]QKE60978.1 hypothetical protein DAX_141 [Vibrio phage Dax]QKN84587.1 hypothetical protein BBMUFFIN_143 [Vibrio phage BBMuffin]QKN85560.1 hypothetical protein DIREPILLOW8_140 [Vibrio phage Direpillow8]WBU76926.1 hypothetical protein KRONOS_143 [Vibrio phage Kronos]QJQ85154.1 hypothetical protein BENNETT_142 [Vibrio phage Bennett]
MFNPYVIIGVLSVSLAGAGYFGYYQTKQLGAAEVKLEAAKLEIKNKEATITQLQIENGKIIEKAQRYQADVQRVQIEKDKIKEKAIKDLGRVEKITKRKSKLYEKLINKDYKNTQRQLEELTQ